jgi:tetratricopeptide (TPR) repeat protein
VFAFTAVSACGYVALECLKQRKLGAVLAQAVNATSTVASGMAGNSGYATAIQWLNDTRRQWSRLDLEANHDLLRATSLAGLLANYRVGAEFAQAAKLQVSDWPLRMPGPEWVRDWLRRPRTRQGLAIATSDDQYWLDVYLNGTVKLYGGCMKPEWKPPPLEKEMARAIQHLEQLTAPARDVNAVFAKTLTSEALADVKANNLGMPPKLEELFQELWFPLFQSAFQAHLKNNQKVANIFFADLLSAIIRSKAPAAQFPADGFIEFRDQIYEHFDSRFDLVVAKLDTMEENAGKRHQQVVTTLGEIGRIIQPPQSAAPNPDWSTCAPLEPGKLPPVTDLPGANWMPYRSLEDRFVGRVAELWKVHRNLEGPLQVAIVSGFAGLGKTQLAIEYAWRFARCYPGGVFWIEAERGRESILDLLQFADLQVGSGRDLAMQIGLLWGALARRRPGAVLVIFDNLPEEAQLNEWLPSRPQIATLVTTRRRGLEGDVPLRGLNDEDCLSILNSRRARWTIADAKRLNKTVDGLPLVIELARGYLDNQPGLTFQELLDEMSTDSPSQEWQRFEMRYGDALPSGHEKNVIATFLMSWNRLEADEDARSVMQAISELAPEPVRLSFLANLEELGEPEGDKRLRLAVDRLSSHSLLDPVRENVVIAHRLMLGFVKEFDPAPHHVRQPVIEAVIAEMNRISNREGIVGTARELTAVAPHAAALCESERCSSEDKRSLGLALSQLEDFRGRYREALRWAELALKKTPSNRPDDTAEAKAQVANCHYHLHNYRESERLFREILALRINQGDRSGIGSACHDLALPLSCLGEPGLRKARELLEKALDIERSQISHDLWNMGTIQAGLGAVLVDLKEPQLAKRHLEAAYSFVERVAKDHPQLSVIRYEIALALIGLGEFAPALAGC